MSTGRTRATGTLLSDGRVLVAGGEGAPGGTTVALNSAEIYDPTTNSWSSAGNMQVARRLAAASRLADGRVLVTGGETTGLTSSTATAEIYDPTTNSWSSAAAMHDARYGQAALTLPDGRVLVIGGDELGSSPADLNGVEAYDLSTNTWTQLPSLTDAREQFGAVALPDGGVVVVGGDQYDPSTSSFVQLATAERYTPPVAGTARADTLPVGRWGHVAVRLQDGRVLIAGGSTATSNYTSSVEVYDPDTNAWSNAAPMNEGRQYFAAVTLKDGRVLAVGGFGGPDPADIGYLASAEVYDPVQDRWTEVPPMSTPRESLTATLLPSGSVLVAGGLNSVGAVNTAELYDPKTNSWSPAGTMSNARESPAAVLLKTGKVLVLGGIDPSGLGVGLRSADLYDPATNAFTPAAPMTIGRDHPLATRLLNGRVLVAGGFVSNSLPVTRSAELYDPATNTWSPAGTMAQERTFGPGLPAATITTLTSGNVLVTGGTTSNGSTLSSAEAYIPALNNWLTVPGLQTPRASQTATLLTDGRVLIASGSGTVTPWLTTSELFAAPAPVSIYDYVFDPTASSTRPGQGVLWTDRQGTHTVVDSALLGGTAGAAQPLFASASLTAGKTFSYTFFAAGTYPYQSTAGEPTAMAGSVTVPVAVTVTRDGTDRLQVTWACTTLPGYAEKVQERFKPLGSSKFGSWATWAAPDGTANWLYTSGLFTPTTTGTYQFRARLLNTDTGHVSGWSTASPLTLRSL
jgi:N-acetylneuraminic acid mutarotase/plastocyanin